MYSLVSIYEEDISALFSQECYKCRYFDVCVLNGKFTSLQLQAFFWKLFLMHMIRLYAVSPSCYHSQHWPSTDAALEGRFLFNSPVRFQLFL